MALGPITATQVKVMDKQVAKGMLKGATFDAATQDCDKVNGVQPKGAAGLMETEEPFYFCKTVVGIGETKDSYMALGPITATQVKVMDKQVAKGMLKGATFDAATQDCDKENGVQPKAAAGLMETGEV